MSTKDEVKAQEPQEVKEEGQNQPEEEVEEEEPVDVELQKQMKNLKFDDSAFTKKEDQKPKEKKEESNQKKSKKNKGQDFLDYASKNNIQINIEYEEDKIQEKRKKYYDKKDPKYNNQRDKNQNGKYQKKPYQNDQNNNYNNGNKYNNRNQGYKRQQKRAPFKFGGNKFDACNIQKGPYEQMPYQDNVYVPRKPIILTTDEEIKQFLEEMFSIATLNKDIYIRRHLNEGLIGVAEVADYYTIKKSDVKPEKIIEIVKSCETLEIKELNTKNYISLKGWNEIKPKLIDIEEITKAKRTAKLQKMQQNMYPIPMEYAPYMGYNYIHMQNNYFIPSQGLYPMAGYTQQMYPYQQVPPQTIPKEISQQK